jgi:uncharacterized repeat protein (TIGR01451 family)
MNNSMKKISQLTTLALLLIGGHFSTFAQGWIHSLDNDMYYVADVAEAPGHGVYVLSQLVNANQQAGSGIVVKYDEAGNYLWRKEFAEFRPVYNLEATENGEVTLLTGDTTPDSTQSAFFRLVHLNGDGDTVWSKKLSTNYFSGTCTRVPNNGYLLTGIVGPFIPGAGYEWGIVKLDNAGNESWKFIADTIDFNSGGFSNPSVAVNNQGNIFFSYSGDTTNTYGGKTRIFSPNGNLLWANNYAFSDFNFLNASEIGSDFLVSGISGSLSNSFMLRRITTTGQTLWSKPISHDFYDANFHDAFTDANGNYVLSGFNLTGSLNLQKILRVDVYNPDGDLVKQISRKLPGYGDLSIWTAQFKPDGQNGYYVSGILSDFAGNYAARFLLRMNADGLIYENFVIGDVRRDLNGDCQQDSTDLPILGQKVRYYDLSNNQQLFSTTDSSGQYVVETAPGLLNIELLKPNNYWQACPQSFLADVQPGDTVSQDFHLLPVVDCPFLEVEIGTGFLHRCFANQYYIRYTNSGTTVANNAYVDVKLDTAMIFDGTLSIFQYLGNRTYRFPVGDVGVGVTGYLNFWVTLSCDLSVPGQTHCVEAHIYPDSICLQNPSWSLASVYLTGVCDGDSIRFTLQNLGLGNMVAPLEYVVIEDNIIFKLGDFQLNAGGEMTVAIPANGKTYRMEAQQEPYHPGNSMPSVAIEGCGQDSLGQYLFGYISLFGEDDGDPFLSIDCQINVGSYDPNEILAMPEGVGAEHIIREGQELDYKILFQNTGNFYATKIVIRDTLPTLMDPATIVPSISSHPYTFDLSGEGIVTFTFDNIYLPDSNANEPASHGFVQYHIAPKNQFMPDGTLFENRAGIYFDFNDPVITNTCTRQIGHLQQITPTKTTEIDQKSNLQIAPTPANEVVYVTLQHITTSENSAILRDLYGKTIETQVFFGKICTIHRKGIPAGVYFLEIETDNKVSHFGKIVWK